MTAVANAGSSKHLAFADLCSHDLDIGGQTNGQKYRCEKHEATGDPIEFENLATVIDDAVVSGRAINSIVETATKISAAPCSAFAEDGSSVKPVVSTMAN